ncbi:Zn-dependent hydrolase [Bacillus suaedae]|uniref:Zn-dependent hydrolase n=1 Tax=Halalkalibacter suaedae TaxID=2822140 RepID=A0A940WXJ7_9BACI|nr:Zn-dependent hydrolase [Bacillus suaedae]MBP3953573.1 Zn-dependent hydrolase [Bacillus suaedae]
MSLYDRLVQAYDKQLSHSGVDGVRVARRLSELSKIGITDENGVNRVGFSVEEQKAKSLVSRWMMEAGLHVTEDGAGNVFGKLVGDDERLAAVLSGSHVDSVPNGGHFDGPLGVISALEVVEAWKANGFQPKRSYEVVIFSDEEGARFNGGLTGSRAMMGEIDPEKQRLLKDKDGLSFNEVINKVGLKEEDFFQAKRTIEEIHAFIEVHIEQGKTLEKMDQSVGIVNGIAGPCWLEIIYKGVAGHAGNTPMNDRKDALVAASEFIASVPHLTIVNETCVATVGKIEVSPNGVNVIPGEVTLYVDIRDIYEESRDHLVELVIDCARKIAIAHELVVTIEEKLRIKPVPINTDIINKAGKSLADLNLRPLQLPSGAGHDAMIVGKELPVGMLFVRSKDGISHNPKEWSNLNDCIEGIHALKGLIEQLVNE